MVVEVMGTNEVDKGKSIKIKENILENYTSIGEERVKKRKRKN
jgi:hypothetical protein